MAAIATPLCIGPADHGRTMTLEEFLEAEAEGREVIPAVLGQLVFSLGHIRILVIE